MKVVGIAGFSGSGKTTLLEHLIPAMKSHGLRVSVIKHSHHDFDIDQPGKDSYRHRQAGAEEVLIASAKRMALMREFSQTEVIDPNYLIRLLPTKVDWLFIEGFKFDDLPKLEVWRATNQRPQLFPDDANVKAVVTDCSEQLTTGTNLTQLDLNQPQQISAWLLSNQHLFSYQPKDQ